jgi:hypothetical protein
MYSSLHGGDRCRLGDLSTCPHCQKTTFGVEEEEPRDRVVRWFVCRVCSDVWPAPRTASHRSGAITWDATVLMAPTWQDTEYAGVGQLERDRESRRDVGHV